MLLYTLSLYVSMIVLSLRGNVLIKVMCKVNQ